jgi:hypothetical protein
MAIHEDVWNDIGYFMPVPKLLGYEDGIFFQRAIEQGLKMGITSDAWLHHYGMITQNALKLEKAMDQRDSLGNRNLMRLYMNQTWVGRKLARYKRRNLLAQARQQELAAYDMTVHALNRQQGNSWEWI